MGKRGPAPKPTVLRELAGNPGKRPLNQAEAKPKQEIPQCPRHLSDEAKKEWHRIVKDLFEAGLFTKIDRPALAAYCQAYGRWVEAEAHLEDEDFVQVTDKGYQYQTPWLSIANQAMKQMHNFLAEFGMTPAARSRVNATPPKEEADELEQLLFKTKVTVKK